MKALPPIFPPPIDGLIRTLSGVGFFDNSLLIGSWVMPIYQELYGVLYRLRTLDKVFSFQLRITGKDCFPGFPLGDLFQNNRNGYPGSFNYRPPVADPWIYFYTVKEVQKITSSTYLIC